MWNCTRQLGLKLHNIINPQTKTNRAMPKNIRSVHRISRKRNGFTHFFPIPQTNKQTRLYELRITSANPRAPLQFAVRLATSFYRQKWQTFSWRKKDAKTHSHSLIFSLSLSLSHTLSQTHTLSLTHFFFSLSLSLTHTHTHIHTHIHTHTLTNSHTHKVTLLSMIRTRQHCMY